MSSIEMSWSKIENWLAHNTPPEICLPDGASVETIGKVEEMLGVSLPKAVRDSYRLHDGSNRHWICDEGYLMPLLTPSHLPKRQQRQYDEVVKSCQGMREMVAEGYFDDPGFVSKPKGPIRTDWWNSKWIPITCNDCGDSLCIDLSPAKGGKKGQVIDWWHEQGATKVVSNSLKDWLSGVADNFEAGEFDYDEKTGKLTKTNQER